MKLLSMLVLAVCAAGQSAGPRLTTLHTFTGGSDGSNPVGSLALSASGVLYGTTQTGGAAGLGTVYSLAPPAAPGGGWTETVLHAFSGPDGATPYENVTIGAGGVLYGTTFNGGSANAGTVYSLTPPATAGGPWTERLLHSFTGAPGDGAAAEASLTIGASGVLYGTTDFGGTANLGTVFSLTPPQAPGGAWTERVLHSCAGGADGRFPNAVTIGTGGVLYATALLDGVANLGIVFSLTPPSTPGGAWTENILHTFTGGSDGGSPEAGLTMGAGGILYGVTLAGGTANQGTIFSMTPPLSPGGEWTETVLHSFAGAAGDAASPYGALARGGGGILYGTGVYGGRFNRGAVFSFTPPSTVTLLHSFSGPDGTNPHAGVAVGPGGVLYGATQAGGSSNLGTAFLITP